MNQRIRELVLQSTIKVNNPSLDSNGEVVCDNWEECVSLEKFAELIVRECANHCDLLLDHKISSEWSRGTHDCSRAIKKHFGVEE